METITVYTRTNSNNPSRFTSNGVVWGSLINPPTCYGEYIWELTISIPSEQEGEYKYSDDDFDCWESHQSWGTRGLDYSFKSSNILSIKQVDKCLKFTTENLRVVNLIEGSDLESICSKDGEIVGFLEERVYLNITEVGYSAEYLNQVYIFNSNQELIDIK